MTHTLLVVTPCATEREGYGESSCARVVEACSTGEAIAALEHEGRSVSACIAELPLLRERDDGLLHALRRIAPLAPIGVIERKGQEQDTVDAIKNHVGDTVVSGLEDERDATISRLFGEYDRLISLRATAGDHLGRNIFVTGATGFLGERLVHDLLRCTSAMVTVLARNAGVVSFADRLSRLSRAFPERLRFVRGDIGKPGLGVADGARKEIEGSVDEVWHLAALTAFEEVLRTRLFNTNVLGTQNVLDFASGFRQLRSFNHVSTAYVAGQRDESTIALEMLADSPPTFRNPYEESKFEAERRVAASGLPHCIFRPSILMGETLSGRNDGKTIYSVAKAVRLAWLLNQREYNRSGNSAEGTFRVAANRRALKNIIPVNAAVSLMMRIRAEAKPEGGVYHVVHPQPATIGDIVEAISHLLGLENYAIVKKLEGTNLSAAERLFQKLARVFSSYMMESDPIFDNSNMRGVLGDVAVPSIDRDYLGDAFHTAYRQHFGVDYAAVPESRGATAENR